MKPLTPAKIKTLQSLLISWFQENAREFPWRLTRDPYLIWISEVMLQQTTTTAVRPFYEKFILRFPTLKDLARAEIEDVYEFWSGLGYYSRARNLHKSAQQLLQLKSFPHSYLQLIDLPGFGPYTARSVASLAFSEPVGVLDGNVIRVLSRLTAEKVAWWESAQRKKLQDFVDQMVAGVDSAEMNQALMELGATVCIPKNPKCLLCPWMNKCEGFRVKVQDQLPLKKPKREQENWIWTPKIFIKSGRIATIPNTYAPFLKGQLIFPGQVSRSKTRPKSYDLRHSITHHNIFIRISRETQFNQKLNPADIKWIAKSDSSRYLPASLLQKVLNHKS